MCLWDKCFEIGLGKGKYRSRGTSLEALAVIYVSCSYWCRGRGDTEWRASGHVVGIEVAGFSDNSFWRSRGMEPSRRG